MYPRIPVLAFAALLGLTPTLGAQPRPAEPLTPISASKLDRVAEIRKALGLSPNYDLVRDLGRVKIAVLDYGFDGVDGKRPYLPGRTEVVEHYDPEFVRRWNLGDPDYRKGFEPGNTHGRQMAQIVWGTTGFQAEGPHFLLLNANGPTMFRRAVRYAIEAKVDLILFAAVFEGAGNYDGHGPITSIVDDAVAAGILWINAAGNYGGTVHNSTVRLGRDNYLQLGRDGSALEFRNLLDENTVTVTLTWNDYQANEDAGTNRDLDLYIEDASGKVIGKSELQQITSGGQSGSGKSLNPRERVVLPALGASEKPYRIRIKYRSGPLADTDRIRVLVQGSRTAPAQDPGTKEPVAALRLLDSSRAGEVYPPADHPRVITVGDFSTESSIGPTPDHRLKPDVIIPDSSAAFTNGEGTVGSSNAAAYFAAVVVTLKAVHPALRTDDLLRYTAALRAANKPQPKPATTPPPGLRDLSRNALLTTGYGPILDRVQQAAGSTPVRLWLSGEGRVVLGVPQRPVDLRGLFPNHPFPDHPQLSGEYECYLGLAPSGRGAALQIVDSFRLRPDSPHKAANAIVPRMAPHHVEIRQIPRESTSLEERTRSLLLDRRWVTPGPQALATLVQR